MKLSGKIVLITGASSGIGKAAALRFAQDKCHLILIARNQEELEKVKIEVEHRGSTAEVLVCDVTKDEELKKVFGNIKNLDVVFNNAGLGFVENLVTQDSSKIITMANVNFTGMILVSKYAAEIMVKQNSGHIIMTSSLAGLIPIPEWSVYVATKWGITGFADSLRAEMHEHNVKVSSLHPGVIKTDFWNRGSIPYSESTAASVGMVANAVYNSIFTNRHKIIVPFYARIIYIAYRWFPALAEFLINRI